MTQRVIISHPLLKSNILILLLPRPPQSWPLVRRMVEELWQGKQPRLLEPIPKLEDPDCPGFSPSIGGEYFEHSRSFCPHRHDNYYCISVQDERGSRWSRRKPNAPSARGGRNGGQIFFANIIFIIIITGIFYFINITLITTTTKSNPSVVAIFFVVMMIIIICKWSHL